MINSSGAREENFEVKESLAKKKGWVQCTSKPRKFLSNRSMLIETKYKQVIKNMWVFVRM
jgi:hypothetical protein